MDEVVQPPGQGPGPATKPDTIAATIFINSTVSSLNALIKQRNFQDALQDCENALALHPNHEKLLEKKIKILCHQGRFDEAYSLALLWLQREPRHPVAIKELKRLKVVIDALKDQDDSEDDEPLPVLPTQALPAPEPMDVSPPHQREAVVRTLHFPTGAPSLASPVKVKTEVAPLVLCCTFCSVNFDSQADLESHCRSDEHKKKITSDEGHSWMYRPPPRGLISEDYIICQRLIDNGRCPYADRCTRAHSAEELDEWKERFKFKRQQLQIAKDKHLHGNTYPEQLMEKLMTAEYPKSVMIANVDYAKVIVNSDLKVSMIVKKCTNAWTFTVTSKICILRAVLLDEASANYFYVSSISVGPKKTQKYQQLENHCQEWKNPDITINRPGEYVYRVKVVFKTDIYGTFRQTLVFDFGSEPVLSREIQVESAPVTDTEQITSEFRLGEQTRWRRDNVAIVEYEKSVNPEDTENERLLGKYSLPSMEKFRFSEQLMHAPSKENYRIWMHQMLYVEEMAMLDQIAKFSVTTSLQLVNRFMLVPGSLSSAKFAQDGELFARMRLEDDLSVDSVAGRLILQNCTISWLAPQKQGNNGQNHTPDKVYEALIEDRGKNFIFLRLSKVCVEELGLSCDQEFAVEVQFQLGRLHLCEMHNAVDALRTLDIVFPSLDEISELPPLQNWEWKEEIGERTNEDQKEAILGIAAYPHISLPPLLMVGPFGTGKTYTLAQAARQVLQEPNTRILICTHSNSAADLYIKDYLHPYVMEGNLDARPLRVLYRQRWIQTVSDTVLQYCIQEMSGPQAGTFRPPLLEDVEKHRVIITTLSTAKLLSHLDLPSGFFTHIFLDEAAQALECEMLIPLSLVGPNTRIVLAGDHMQMSPDVFSDFGRQQQFHKSLLERLYDLYPDSSPCKVMLCENYRSNRAIIEFTSELFYDHKLNASKDPVAHSVYYPLTFFTARGEEQQHQNSSGFHNVAEMYEVLEQVEHLYKHWPQEWGEFDENSICVVAPYSDQVLQIRAELRKKKMYKVAVERVVNVQGKQFRVMILSTVRTRHTIGTDAASVDNLNLGFLSNVKLLNTAITRAQSLVIVVGDPVSLCLIGKCSKVWEYYLEVCNNNGSFFGLTWSHLRSLLNGVEMKKTYILNPLAPEFVPKPMYHGQHGQPVFMAPAHTGGPWPHMPGHRAGPRGNPHPQMYHPPAAAYMPVMYPPYQGYHPYYGPVVYRPHPGMYPGSPGKPLPRVGLPRQQALRGKPQPILPAPAPAWSPSRESDDSRALTSSPKTSPPAQQNIPTRSHAQAAKKVPAQSRGRPVFVPRMPMQYPPYYGYPPQYMVPAEDPRYVNMGVPQVPYYYNYGSMPRQPYPYMMQPMVPLVPRAPGSGSVSPASSTEGVPLRVQTLGSSERDTPGSDSDTYSPALSPSYLTGQQIQMLPNVKHVPTHLLSGSPGSANSSRSNTPVHTVEERTATASPLTKPVDIPPTAPAATEMEFPTFRKRHHSGPRPVSQSPNYSSQSSHESSSSPVPDGEPVISDTRTVTQSQPVKQTQSAIAAKHAARMPKPLMLKTTGFSRQFSDELGTPTEITNLVKMIEENIEEVNEEVEQGEKVDPYFSEDSPQYMKPSPPTGKLYLNLRAPPIVDTDQKSTSGSSVEDDVQLSVPGPIRPRQQLPSYKEPDYDPTMLEPQTPMTPAGFHTAGTDTNTDPLGILRNLNINNDSLNKSANGHFPS